ncbi:MAG: alpha/beta hydrolase [Chitinophagales bacterium]
MTHIEWNWTHAGYQLYAQGWAPEKPRAVIALVHGFAEHGGRFAHVADFFCQNGIAVLAIDQYGHGKTEGPRGYSPSLEASMDSIGSLLEEAAKRFPGLPRFLYGHSMGGNMVLNYTLRRKPAIAGVIATAPWLRLGFEPPAFKLFLAKIMKNVYPKFPEKADLDTGALSRDAAEVRKYEQDPLVHNTARAGTFFDTHHAASWAIEHANSLTIPCYIAHGTADRLIAFSGSEDFVKNAPKQLITFQRWDGFYHELHNEPQADREKVLNGIITWVNSRI